VTIFKSFTIFFFLILSIISCKKQISSPTTTITNYNVIVSNGYGSGSFKVGDSVHIWARNCLANETFNNWTIDSSILNGRNEWHSWFIMPEKNVNLTANIKTVNYQMIYEKIKGKSVLKNVYYFFPTSHKGIVYLFHGSNGSASNWTKNYENTALIKDLISEGLAIVITEAEEVSLNTDTNGDGSLRWNTSNLDSSNNVDFANIKAISDTFYNRKFTNRTIPRYCVGQSNGGSASIAVASYFKMKASVAYCASGGATSSTLNTTNTPIKFCLQQWDNNSVMGLQGNANAISNSDALKSRGVCTGYNINISSPIYPSRFSRNLLISETTSTLIFNELKTNNLLTDKNLLKGYAQNVWDAAKLTPQKFPTIATLTTDQLAVVDEQLSCTTADHQFYSDANKKTIQFLIMQCQ